MWSKENPGTLLGGVQVGAATVESSAELLQKLTTELPRDPAMALLGIQLKKPETPI